MLKNSLVSSVLDSNVLLNECLLSLSLALLSAAKRILLAIVADVASRAAMAFAQLARTAGCQGKTVSTGLPSPA